MVTGKLSSKKHNNTKQVLSKQHTHWHYMEIEKNEYDQWTFKLSNQ